MSRRERWDAEFTEFMVARRDQLYRTAYLLTTSATAAEDLVQTGPTKTYVAWGRVRVADDPASYVHRTMINTFLSERRRRSAGEIPVEQVADRAAGPAEIDPGERILLLAALRRLGPTDRAVVVLRHWEDRSVAEVARDLGLSEAAVKNRTLRALRELRTHLSEHDVARGPLT